MNKIGFVSLGCPKNRVDTELMMGALKDSVFTPDPADADIIIVNTCGFIESAKQESINTVLEMAQYKKTGRLKGLIVTGCLSERYREELADAMPEVDAFLGMYAYDGIAEAISAIDSGRRFASFTGFKAEPDYTERRLTTPFYQAYLRISEGCDNRCAYCAIPYIRGGLRSRLMEDIEREAEHLVKKGVSEIVLVAQDTTVYGRDAYGRPMIRELLDRLSAIEGVRWLRLLYAYPDGVTDGLLECMAEHDNIVKYIDMPIQHLSDDVLMRMHRHNTRESTYAAVARVRAAHPDFVLRTTLMTGFPGETERDFEILKQGVKELCFDKLGVFAFSPEDGTPAADMRPQLPARIKKARADAIMELQAPISLELNRARIGRTVTALVEERLTEGYSARTYADSPDIDGKLYIRTDKTLTIGDYCEVRITDADEYDLMGETL